ncbi:efflux RND transporter periplasmic adaptor subunit, partial [bacterium]|nr:efflux RND transporter periplasmic adaptor subunit [bacterium]
KKKIWIAVIILAVIICAIIFIKFVTTNGNNKRNQQLKTTAVERGDIVIKITESGSVEPLTTVDIKSEFSGEVKKIFVDEGDSVQKGDKLAQVQQESSTAQQIAQSKASYEQARLNLEESERNLNRMQELYDKGFIALKEVEDAQKSYDNNRIQYQLSEKKLWLTLGGSNIQQAQELGEKTFDNIVIKSPMTGVIVSLNVEEGEMITSGTSAYGGGGTVLMTVADLSKLLVKTEINEVDIGKVTIGQPVDIGFDAIRGKVYRGVVRKISPTGTISNNIVIYPVEIEIIGSAAGSFSSEDQDTRRRPMEKIFSQLNEKQQKEMRSAMMELYQEHAGREEIRAAMEAKLKEFGIELPEEPSEQEAPPAGANEIKEGAGIGLIKPGMTADLDIIVSQAKNTLVIPREAVKEEGTQSIVMVKVDNEITKRTVKTGLEGDVNIEISEGLKEGETILLSPSDAKAANSGEGQHPGPPPQ